LFVRLFTSEAATVEMDHGRFPVPPPAVAELLKGAPVYSH